MGISPKGVGHAFPVNFKKVAENFKLASKDGHIWAMYNLGEIYSTSNHNLVGNNIPSDDKTSFYWYNMAAEKGHSRAQLEVANMYLIGKGVAVDEYKAIEYFLKVQDKEIAAEGKIAWLKRAQAGDVNAEFQLKMIRKQYQEGLSRVAASNKRKKSLEKSGYFDSSRAKKREEAFREKILQEQLEEQKN